MLKILKLTMLFLIIVLAAGQANTALAADEGFIKGQVVNGTVNSSPIGVVEVSLTRYINGQPDPTKTSIQTNPDGSFEFDGLSTDNTSSYVVSASFKKAEYYSGEITLTPETPFQTIELTVYDSTTSDENITVSNGHMVIYVDQGDLEVLEIWRFNNSGDTTFTGIGGNPAEGTLRFNLPENAVALTPGTGPAVQMTGLQAVSTAVVPPGITDIDFSYFIPYQGSDMEILRKTDYPTDKFSLLVQDAGVKVASAALAQGSSQMMNGMNFLYFNGSNLTAGIDLDASLSGVVKPTVASTGSFVLWPWFIGGAAALAIIAALAYSRMKNRETDEDIAMPIDTAGLLEEIARLDDAYEAGKLKEKEYRTQRGLLKASLLEAYSHSRAD